nr:hypothetical protein [Tanacetum cinerariifolium]
MQSRESKVVSSKALDASLVVTECSGTKSDEHITSSSLGTYMTHVVDADIRPVNNQKLSAEVYLIAQHNVLANEQHHTDQSEPSYDTYLLEKVDSNTTLNSTNMCHRGGEIDQDVEQDQVKSSFLKAEFLKINDMVEKEFYNELSNRFLQLEKHCIFLEISIQQKEESFQSNKPCKNQDSPKFCKFFEINKLKAQLQAKNSMINNLTKQIKNVHEKSNEAKVKHDTDVIKTINIELEHKVAKLLKKNETLKKYYKDLYDSIKVTRTTTIEQTTYLIAKNDEFKAQLQENRNSTKESYRSNDMAHIYYLEEAKKKTQNKIMNLKPSVMHTTSLQDTTNGRKPKPRSNNQTSRSLLVPKSSRGMLNEVNYRAKVQSPKSRNNIKPAKRILNVNKSESWISKGYMFSPNKSSIVHEKTNTPRSCLRWKPTGRIFKTAGLRWIPTGKMFIYCTTKFDSEPLNGSNDDITHPYECDQTLNVSVAVAAPRAIDPAGLPSLTTIDQDVPSASTSPTI